MTRAALAVLALLLLPPPATAAGAANLRPFEGPPVVREATALVQPVARTLTMLTSSYCLPGTTATGARVGVGIVAADIAQLPFGTRLYVAGYGFAKVEDDGPAITQNRLDLWLPPAHGCAASFAWGMRRVTVEILGRPYLSRHVPPRLRAADVRYVRERGKAA